MFSTKIIADSIAPCGVRLTTWELTYPRYIHSEVMTHRVFSRNSASSRAIPVEKLMQRIADDPVMPQEWGKNQPGMQAPELLTGQQLTDVQRLWLEGRDNALALAKKLAEVGLHKQIANRVIEPWMYITVLVTATEWDNWYALRDHKDAHPDIRWIAHDMREKYNAVKPAYREAGSWHLPLVTQEERYAYTDDALTRISTGRCARVSYLTHDGKRDPQADADLCERLTTSGHMSPLEHPAMALATPIWRGNFRGWKQYRKMIPMERVFGAKGDGANHG